MTTDILTDAGEEYVVKNGLDAASIIVGVYNDSTDSLGENTTDPSTAITTEPSNANYSRVTDTFTAAETSTDVWGVDNDSQITFDFSDQTSTETVDAFFLLVNFTSDEEGGTSGDWIIGNAAMTQSRDIGSVDSIDIAAGDLEINFD